MDMEHVQVHTCRAQIYIKGRLTFQRGRGSWRQLGKELDLGRFGVVSKDCKIKGMFVYICISIRIRK